MTKPFSLEELVARIRTILRRTGQAAAEIGAAPVRGPRARRGVARGPPRRRADRADGDRVPAAALPDAEPAAGADPRAAARPRLGLRLRRRRPRAGDLHQLPAQEARRARAVADQDGARRRLRAAGADAADVIAARPRAGERAGAGGGGHDRGRRGHLRGAALVPATPASTSRRGPPSARSRACWTAPGCDRRASCPAGTAPASPARRRRPGEHGGAPVLPPGTYGQRRDGRGRSDRSSARSATARANRSRRRRGSRRACR